VVGIGEKIVNTHISKSALFFVVRELDKLEGVTVIAT